MSETDDLLDATLDDLEDLPEFAVFPAGAHRCLATLSIKEVNDKQAVELELKLIEHLEFAEPASDQEMPAGTIASTLFMLDNEFGRGNLKKIAKPLGESLGTGVLRDIIEQTTEMEVAVITSIRRPNKKAIANGTDPDARYLNIKELQVA